VAQLAAVVLLQQPVGRELVVAVLADALRVGAAQDVGDVGAAEALAAADHAGEDLLRDHERLVDALQLAEADVARAARAVRRRERLAEVRGEEAVAAGRAAREGEHLADPAHRLVVVDQRLPRVEVGRRVEHHALGRQPVAAGAAALLHVLLDPLRQVGVDDEADVGAIDPHAERDRRDDDVDVLVQELLLVAMADLVLEARVVGHRATPRAASCGRPELGVLAPDAVDDAGLARMARDHPLDLRDQVAARLEAVGEVGAIAAADEARRIAQAELLDDVLAHGRRRGRGERLDRDLRVVAPQLAEHAVLGPEVVAPVADAVRLVDHEAGEPAPRSARRRSRRDDALGRDVDELQLAGHEPLADRAPVVGILRRREHAAATPLSFNPSTWSFMSEMSGLTTAVTPGRSSAGAW
jgi:hypothetical protein